MTNRHNFTLHDQYMMEQRDTLGLHKNDVISIQQQRREAMKREATRKAIARSLDVIICSALAFIMMVTLYLIAIGSLPLLGGIAVLVALAACFACVCNSFSKS